ncbi:ARS-binding 2 [Lecanosticta acicola]|uniref:ARS-binding 2 n=1 Tax=Lecanosticta acicola TaxID=111012 RepID=A0AAI8Z578_9PEZI|nr:ARS-binding 2 [Lecanosticta acicola]
MYRHDPGAGAEQHYQLQAGSGSSPFAQAHFDSPIYGIDPALHNRPQHLHPATRLGQRSSPHMRQSSNELSASMQPPTSSPRMNNSTPGPGNASLYSPTDRRLPPKDVSAENIAEVYTDFILYCNPNFPLDVDTSTLKTTFQTPPKSDNKDFETFRLFELIRKFHAKEIKTWGQLALDLGVEAPDTTKGQSVQKVQQYSVRLKRWMRAMHIDAFFEYLLGKQHNYFTEIPHPNDPYPSTGRDGVMAEEDLAIRALDPSFRPKRGRRRNSEAEREEENEAEPASKQPRLLDHPAPYSGAPMSSIPLSANPDNYHDPWAVASAVTPQSFAPWSARPGGPPSAFSSTSNLRWQLGQTPSTPHPMSAIPTSMSAHIDAAFDGEPKSAVTPSSRRRRKHGPAVSSAWSSNTAPGSKPRGRPPANRNVQDGPYGTFPVDPTNEKSRAQSSTPADGVGHVTNSFGEDRSPPQLDQPTFQPQSEGRPGRLSLQVPPHTGAPVRLATPPTLLVNGETNETGSKSDSDDASRNVVAVTAPPHGRTVMSTAGGNAIPGFSFEALKRVVTSDLLRADIIGRKQRLTGDEAKRLADAVLERLGVSRSDSDNPRDSLARLTAASWLGLGDQFNVPLGPSAGHGKRINVTRFRTDAEGYEEITFDEDADDVREVFDIFWQASQGGCTGSFEMKGLSLSPHTPPGPTTETLHDLILRKSVEGVMNLEKDGWLEKNLLEVARAAKPFKGGGGDDGVNWKARCMALEFAAKIAQGEVQRAQQRMIEKMLNAVL